MVEMRHNINMGLQQQYYNDNNNVCTCCDPWGDHHTIRKDASSSTDADAAAAQAGDDAYLAKEMNALTVEERERVFDDIHGVRKLQDESPEFVSKRIQEMDEALERLPVRERKIYNRAVFLKPKLQNDQDFKLMFLRAEEFDPRKAAERMIKYFTEKNSLFGDDKLVKRLTLDDLTEKDIKLFKIGYMTLLPFRDNSGRPIIFGDGTKLDFEWMTIDSIIRAFWYLITSTLFDDEQSQKKGICIIMRFSGTRRSMSKSTELAKRTANNNYCYPGRFTSVHICYDDPRMNFVLNAIRIGSGRSTRVRTRAHYGTELENDYKLMTFGIPCHDLLQGAKRGDTDYHEKYLLRRKAMEAQGIAQEVEEEIKTGLVAYPKKNDVLIGRGQPYRDLPGNQIWDNAVNAHFDRYHDAKSTSTFEKTCISMEIVKTVKDSGARFLERTNDGWKELDDVQARKKTGVAFRNRGRSNTHNTTKGSSSNDATTTTAAAITTTTTTTATGAQIHLLPQSSSSHPSAKRQRVVS